MNKVKGFLFLFFLLGLCGCSLGPGKDSDRIDMEEWCGRDARMPWTGCWTEVAQIDCDSGQEFVPKATIEEFRLTSDGIFSVTWSPFETYVDYAGPYSVNEKARAIELTLGDLAPPRAIGKGRFTITDEGELLVEGIWLGSRDLGSATVACGHRMQLRSQR
jgi:hypothetical protein